MSALELTPRAAGLLARIRPLVLDAIALGSEGEPVLAAIVQTIKAARHESAYELGKLEPTEPAPTSPPGGDQ